MDVLFDAVSFTAGAGAGGGTMVADRHSILEPIFGQINGTGLLISVIRLLDGIKIPFALFRIFRCVDVKDADDEGFTGCSQLII